MNLLPTCKLFFVALLLLLAGKAMSYCVPSVPDHYPGNNPPDYYGNSNTDGFRCALYGEDNDIRKNAEEIAKLIPESHKQRWYVRVGLHGGTQRISEADNITPAGDNASSLGLASDNTSSASNGLNIGFGYNWSDYRIDFEWLPLKDITYVSSVLNAGTAVNFVGVVQGDAFLLNLHYDFNEYRDFKFYANAAAGFTNNEAELNINSSAGTSYRKLGLSIGGGVGTYYNIHSNYYIDLAVRYLYLGEVHFEDSASSGGALLMTANRSWAGAKLSVIWII